MYTRLVLLSAFFVCISFSLSSAQVVQMAANCDTARKELLELVAKPDAIDAQKIRQQLGMDILVTCDRDDGSVVCFQCIDDNQKLRSLQILQKKGTKRFEVLGFGCRCQDNK